MGFHCEMDDLIVVGKNDLGREKNYTGPVELLKKYPFIVLLILVLELLAFHDQLLYILFHC